MFRDQSTTEEVLRKEQGGMDETRTRRGPFDEGQRGKCNVKHDQTHGDGIDSKGVSRHLRTSDFR